MATNKNEVSRVDGLFQMGYGALLTTVFGVLTAVSAIPFADGASDLWRDVQEHGGLFGFVNDPGFDTDPLAVIKTLVGGYAFAVLSGATLVALRGTGVGFGHAFGRKNKKK